MINTSVNLLIKSLNRDEYINKDWNMELPAPLLFFFSVLNLSGQQLLNVTAQPLTLMKRFWSHLTPDLQVLITIPDIKTQPGPLPQTRSRSSPAAWESQDRQGPHLRPPLDQRRCGSGPAGCPGPPAPWRSCVSGSRRGPPSQSRCSPPSGPGSWCTWGAGSWRTSWRWPCRSERWLCGTALNGQAGDNHINHIYVSAEAAGF